MAVKQGKNSTWEVDYHNGKALEGFKRIRKKCGSREEAETLHAEVVDAVQTFGKWPVGPFDKPLEVATKRKSRRGTLREAAELALQYHWHGTSYGATVETIIWQVIEWMEDQGCGDIDKITSYHLDKFITYRRELGNSNETINKYLSIFSVLNKIGLDRRPPLCSTKLPLKRLKVSIKEKWWLRPEELERLVVWLESRGDEMFADYIRLVCFQGFRAEETLRLETRHFFALDTPSRSVLVPGTKTEGSEASIPVFDLALPTVKGSIERAKRQGWKRLFPMTLRKAQNKWNECRAFLGVQDIPTATLKSLRRTFASYANSRGMPTATLQRVLRHSGIGTTEGYLRLVGATALDNARDFMSDAKQAPPPPIPQADTGMDATMRAISAYKSTGASPEEIARFAKELLK